ncbi:uncharacterized protein N7482_008684 [Penicillium canariense]|uniref:Uncharacterized protein n=1 Tax=Penicillium canariense TaxID=189055 RepID=A0A9W9HWA8_9EURO|nr:uncharacterized protein N7482_008684 [Penicillium canariense]KAJ5157584.1 hypothetical protein N7482_008684 [Penicillium canariense]
MSNGRSTSPITVPESENRPRRGSVASGLPFTDLFSKQNNFPSGHQTGNIQTNQPRRLSITTLGLSGSPTQTSTFGSRAFRQGSLSSSWGSAPNNEDAVAEDIEGSPGATPSSPLARRVSFGAQALREARAGSIGNGRYPPPSSSLAGARRPPSSAAPGDSSAPGNSPPSRSPAASASSSATPLDERSNASRRPGEGFNWTEALRHRAERAPSIGGPPQSPVRQAGHQRAASIASMEQPVREIPKQPKQNKPDFFQEKILRGDFMD